MPCIEEAKLAEFDPLTDELAEVVRFSAFGLLLRVLWSGGLMTTLTALIITSLLAVMGTAFLMGAAIAGNIAPGKGFEMILNAAYGLGMFFGFSWLFVAVVGFPFMFVLVIAGCRRELIVNDGQLGIKTPFADHKLNLSECKWTDRTTLMDSYGAYLPWSRPGSMICKESRWFACGFDEKKRLLWQGFLTLSGVERKEHTVSSRRKLFLGLVYGYLLGGCVGSMVGLVAYLITGDWEYLSPWIFLGMLEGPILSAWYVMLKTSSGAHQERLKRRYNFAIAFLNFVAIGMMVLSFKGIQGMMICGFVNGILGSIAALVVTRPALRSDDAISDED